MCFRHFERSKISKQIKDFYKENPQISNLPYFDVMKSDELYISCSIQNNVKGNHNIRTAGYMQKSLYQSIEQAISNILIDYD